MTDPSPAGEGLKSRLVAELKRYAVVSLYLFVCFAVILIYEASQSPHRQATALGLGVALGKALIMGKFILIGEALKPGTRIGAPNLLARVAWRSLGMLVVLVVLKLIEELIVGLVHGQSVGAIVEELAGRSWLSLLGPVLLMLLILVPLMIAIELDRALGDERLSALLLGRENP
jgi:hypothetical protein